jgi:hypothetical protein
MKVLEVDGLVRLEDVGWQILQVRIQVRLMRGMLLRVEHGDGVVGLGAPVADV